MTPQTTAYRVEKLTTIEMPMLSAVVSQLSPLTGDDETEVNQLAEDILQDPHMTSQVLKTANSDTRLLIKKASASATLVGVEFGAAKVCHLIPNGKDVTHKKSSKKSNGINSRFTLTIKNSSGFSQCSVRSRNRCHYCFSDGIRRYAQRHWFRTSGTGIFSSGQSKVKIYLR
jgi:hypothetical protein